MKTDNKCYYVTVPPLDDEQAVREYFGIHTPGPWVFDESGGVWKLRGFPEKEEVIAAAVPPSELDEWLDGQPPKVIEEWRRGRMKANARLIAAAPQLLNSLLVAYERDEKFVNEITRLQDIIMKALGKSTVEDMRMQLLEATSLWEQILLRKELNEEDE